MWGSNLLLLARLHAVLLAIVTIQAARAPHRVTQFIAYLDGQLVLVDKSSFEVTHLENECVITPFVRVPHIVANYSINLVADLTEPENLLRHLASVACTECNLRMTNLVDFYKRVGETELLSHYVRLLTSSPIEFNFYATAELAEQHGFLTEPEQMSFHLLLPQMQGHYDPEIQVQKQLGAAPVHDFHVIMENDVAGLPLLVFNNRNQLLFKRTVSGTEYGFKCSATTYFTRVKGAEIRFDVTGLVERNEPRLRGKVARHNQVFSTEHPEITQTNTIFVVDGAAQAYRTAEVCYFENMNLLIKYLGFVIMYTEATAQYLFSDVKTNCHDFKDQIEQFLMNPCKEVLAFHAGHYYEAEYDDPNTWLGLDKFLERYSAHQLFDLENVLHAVLQAPSTDWRKV